MAKNKKARSALKQTILLFNKPFQVLSQFTDEKGRATLSDFITDNQVYPAGRLDYDSEGLLVLTSDNILKQKITQPNLGFSKTYFVQVEGSPKEEQLEPLKEGILLKDGMTLPAKYRLNQNGWSPPNLWERNPPIRFRKTIPTTWLEITISEGRNRQVRRMMAEVGFPVLRLIRFRVGSWTLDGIDPGKYLAV
jgi:23S rRNA pseudouridine2457 synthase